MDILLRIIICIGFFAASYYYLLVHLPKKEKRKEHQKKAFELTKEIGNKKIRCVSVKTTFNNQPGRVFYIIEEGAENDSTKYCTEIAQGWDNSAHTIAYARKIASDIIDFMPYRIWIEDLDVSWAEYFQPREHDKKMRELKRGELDDRENLDFYLITDLCDEKMHIERFLNTGSYFKDYWYVLVIECETENKYLALFSYATHDAQYAKMRVDHYISHFNECNLGSGNISSDIIEVNQEIGDFLETHPRYTHQYLYKYLNPLSINSIEPYYEEK